MAFAQAADMLARYDARRIGDLVQDDGTRVSSSALTSGNAVLQQALEDGSGMILAALVRGQKYTSQDLINLLAQNVSPGSAFSSDPQAWQTFWSCQLLIRLNCDLAYGLLVARRGYNSTDTDSQATRYQEALRQLQLLEAGEWIFSTGLGHEEAGNVLPGVVISQQVGLLSASAFRYFGNLVDDPRNQTGGGSGASGPPF